MQPESRHFLFLQGPHGPFFAALARRLRLSGARVTRVGFNAGDRLFWGLAPGYRGFHGKLDEWRGWLNDLIPAEGVTDIVLYGDARPVHEVARDVAAESGVTIHVFEEGYLRPYWVTYERGGSNGHSALAEMRVADMQARMGVGGAEPFEVPAHWGALRQHVFYGALYHFFVLALGRFHPGPGTHRALSVAGEFRLYLRKLALMPLDWSRRLIGTRRVRRAAQPYHIVLMQLAHDANFVAHSPFRDVASFIGHVIAHFAAGAPAHHLLVFKAHPLEDGRVPVARLIRQAAAAAGISDRVHYLRGGKLGPLLDHANSAVTVNSTAAQQVLFRGLPLRAFGPSVYAKPEFVSNRPLFRFFAEPDAPDRLAYHDYRRFLLATSQLPGSFYSRAGRQQLLRKAVDAMLSRADPYTAMRPDKAAEAQHKLADNLSHKPEIVDLAARPR